jgi:Xaa-Pro dipeptidase
MRAPVLPVCQQLHDEPVIVPVEFPEGLPDLGVVQFAKGREDDPVEPHLAQTTGDILREGAQCVLARRDLIEHLFIVSSLDSIYYLCGAGFEPLERPFFLLVRAEGAPVLLVPKLDQEHMKKAYNITVENIHTYWKYPAPAGRNWPDRLREEISSAIEVGIEPTLRQEIVEELRMFSIRVEPLVERLRLIKSSTEIKMIGRAAKYADFGVERLLAASCHGSAVATGFAEARTVTSRIIRELERFEPLTTKVIMATWPAPESAMPHSIPNLRDELRKGPHVALVFLRVNGYAAESERTYFTHPPSPDERRTFSAMMEARRVALGMIRPDLPCAEIDSTVREFLESEGYGGEEQRLHRTGHGIGLGNHEGPWISEGSDNRLAANMVISIEPGIYLRDVGGFRHSDTVLVTEDGFEVLTKYPDTLDHLVLPGWRPIPGLKDRLVRRALGLPPRRRRVNPEGSRAAKLVALPPADDPMT